MEKDWHNLDLRNSTIFDLTDDVIFLKSELGYYWDKPLEHKKNVDPMINACEMMTYAIRINDIELQEKLKVIFKSEYDLNEEIMSE